MTTTSPVKVRFVMVFIIRNFRIIIVVVAAVVMVVFIRLPTVPSQQCLSDVGAGLAGHARRNGAGTPVPAPALLQPARPEAEPQVLPRELHRTVREAPHQLLHTSPLLLAALQPHAAPVPQAERPEILQEIRSGLVSRPAFVELVAERRLVSIGRLLDGKVLLIKQTAELSA